MLGKNSTAESSGKKSWMAKAGKSVGFSAYEALGNLSPNIKKTIEVNSDVIKKSTLPSKVSKELTENSKKVVSEGKQTAKALVDSIKTGKFYSKDRAKEADNEMLSSFMGEGFDPNEFDDLENFDFDSDDSIDIDEDDIYDDEETFNDDKDEVKQSINLSSNLTKNTYIDASGFSNLDIYNMNQSLSASSTAIVSTLSVGFTKLSDSINRVTNSVSEQASNQGTLLDKNVELLEKIKDNLSYTSIKDVEESKSLETMLSGTFSLGGLISNLESSVDNVPEVTGMIFSMTVQALRNPLAYLGKIGAEKLLNDFDKKTKLFTDLNSSVEDLHLTGINKLKDFGGAKTLNALKNNKYTSKVVNDKNLSKIASSKLGKKFNIGLNDINSSNPLSSIIDKISGVENDRKLSSAKKASDKVDYDGMTYNSINVVIPGYLNKILQTVSGKDIYHDYKSGKWLSKDKFKETDNEKLLNSVSNIDRVKELLSPAVTNDKDGDKTLKQILGRLYKGQSDSFDTYGIDFLDSSEDLFDFLDEDSKDTNDTKSLLKGIKSEDTLFNLLKGSTGSKISTYQKIAASSHFKNPLLGSTANIFNDETGINYTNLNDNSSSYKVNLDLTKNSPIKTTDNIIENIKDFLFSVKDLLGKGKEVESLDDNESEDIDLDKESNKDDKETSKEPKSKESPSKESTIEKESPNEENSDTESTDNEDSDDESLSEKYKGAKDSINKFKESKIGKKVTKTKLGSKASKLVDKGTGKIDDLITKSSATKGKIIDKAPTPAIAGTIDLLYPGIS